MVRAPFMENFMLPVPEASFAGHGNLLREVGRRVHPLAKGDVVVGQKDHLQPVADGFGSLLITSPTEVISLIISLAMW
jgi:hypothetical protein